MSKPKNDWPPRSANEIVWGCLRRVFLAALLLAVCLVLAFAALMYPLESTRWRVERLGGKLDGSTRVDFSGSSITDADLSVVDHFPGSVSWLALDDTQIGDLGMSHLAKRGWYSLSLANTRVTDAGIAKLDPVQNLNLRDTAVTDLGLETLQHFEYLEILNLENTRITDQGLVLLQRIGRLRVLDLGGTAITDRGLQSLEKKTSLTAISLGNTRITDAGVASICALPQLYWLDLSGTQITDASLASLAGRENLGVVTLSGTDVTPAAIAELQRGLPKLVIK